MPEQLSLSFGGLRQEYPAMRVSWRDAAGVVHRVTRGPHCIDHDWPWFRPGVGW